MKPMRTLRLLAAILLLIGLNQGREASAHAEHGAGEPVPQVVAPRKLPRGVDLLVVKTTAHQFSLSTDGEQDVEVLAQGGEPFIRVRQRIVQANLNSPHWYRSQQPGGGQVPARLKSGDSFLSLKPDWKPVAQQAGFGWYDPRLVDETLKSFKLSLKVNGTQHVLDIERKPLAAFKGYWSSQLTREPDSIGSSALIPGLSTGAIAFTRDFGSRQSFEVLDAHGTAFIRSTAEGYWVDAGHAWFKDLGLFVNRSDAQTAMGSGGDNKDNKSAGKRTQWIQVSNSRMLTYQDPRLSAPKDDSRKVRTWSIPVRLMEDGKTVQFAGEMHWKSTR